MNAETPPPKPERRPYHHGDLRQALIAAGLELLEEQGLEALTLRAIAARVGVSHTAPRHQFPSLRALHTAIAAEGFRRHARAMRDGLTEASTRADRFRAATKGYVAFAAREPALFALMFSWHRVDHDDPDLRTAGSESYGVLREVSEGLIWPGAEGPDRQKRTEAMVWSFVHGYAALAEAGLLASATGLPCEPGQEGSLVLSVMPAFDYE
jgi:AcrR family transcriptional regulator